MKSFGGQESVNTYIEAKDQRKVYLCEKETNHKKATIHYNGTIQFMGLKHGEDEANEYYQKLLPLLGPYFKE